MANLIIPTPLSPHFSENLTQNARKSKKAEINSGIQSMQRQRYVFLNYCSKLHIFDINSSIGIRHTIHCFKLLILDILTFHSFLHLFLQLTVLQAPHTSYPHFFFLLNDQHSHRLYSHSVVLLLAPSPLFITYSLVLIELPNLLLVHGLHNGHIFLQLNLS